MFGTRSGHQSIRIMGEDDQNYRVMDQKILRLEDQLLKVGRNVDEIKMRQTMGSKYSQGMGMGTPEPQRSIDPMRNENENNDLR